jgi:hypothetical protein
LAGRYDVPMLRVLPRLKFIEPQLPTLVDEPPAGKRWIHEIKHDGYRSQLLIERGEVRVFTRNGFDWSDRFSSIVKAARAMPAVQPSSTVRYCFNRLGFRTIFAGRRMGRERWATPNAKA